MNKSLVTWIIMGFLVGGLIGVVGWAFTHKKSASKTQTYWINTLSEQHLIFVLSNKYEVEFGLRNDGTVTWKYSTNK